MANHTAIVAEQLASIARRPLGRAWNELRDGFGPDDHQAIDAPRMLPAASFSNAIAMRRAMVIQARGGDFSAA